MFTLECSNHCLVSPSSFHYELLADRGHGFCYHECSVFISQLWWARHSCCAVKQIPLMCDYHRSVFVKIPIQKTHCAVNEFSVNYLWVLLITSTCNLRNTFPFTTTTTHDTLSWPMQALKLDLKPTMMTHWNGTRLKQPWSWVGV